MKICLSILFIISANVAYLQNDFFYPNLKKNKTIKNNIPIIKDSVVVFELKTKNEIINLYVLASCIVESDSLIIINSLFLPYNDYVEIDNVVYEVLKSNDSTTINMDTIYSKNHLIVTDGVSKKKKFSYITKLIRQFIGIRIILIIT